MLHSKLRFFAAALGALWLAAPLPAPTTSQMLPVSDTLLLTGGDSVDFSGQVHVVTQVYPPDPILPPDPVVPVTVYINLAGVSGMGTSGIRYQAVGTAMVDTTTMLPGTVTVIGDGFRAVPQANSQPPDPIRVQVMLSIDAAGSVFEATVQLLEGIT